MEAWFNVCIYPHYQTEELSNEDQYKCKCIENGSNILIFI